MKLKYFHQQFDKLKEDPTTEEKLEKSENIANNLEFMPINLLSEDCNFNRNF